MSLGSEIQALAANLYASGTHPIDFAEHLTCSVLEEAADYPVDPHDEAQRQLTARRILGLLLDAGWTPPDLTP